MYRVLSCQDHLLQIGTIGTDGIHDHSRRQDEGIVGGFRDEDLQRHLSGDTVDILVCHRKASQGDPGIDGAVLLEYIKAIAPLSIQEGHQILGGAGSDLREFLFRRRKRLRGNYDILFQSVPDSIDYEQGKHIHFSCGVETVVCLEGT